MGIKNLIKLVDKFAPDSIKDKSISDYRNKILGIDANLMLYKMVYAIRRNGYDLENDGVVVTHIHATLQKLAAFKKYNILPIFVFDGMPPKIKKKTMDDRRAFKDYMMVKYYKAVTQDEKKKYYYMKSDITLQEIEEMKELIDIYGYTWIDSVEEADSQLAHMSKKGSIDGIVTDDMDILVFGGKKLIKNFSVAEKKKMQEIDLDTLLKKLDITQEQLVDIGILLGCDYCPTVKGIGPIKSYGLIKQYGNIDKLIKKGIVDLTVDYDKARDYFLNPKVSEQIKFKKGVLDKDRLIRFLENKKYSSDRIDKYL